MKRNLVAESRIQQVFKWKRSATLVVPYSQGLCERYKTIYSKYDIQVHFEGAQTLKNLLVFPKDKDTITKQSRVIYWFKCDKTPLCSYHPAQSYRTLLLGLFCVKVLSSILSKAHAGYLHLVRTSLKCCCSILSSSCVKQTALAMCTSVLMTLHLAAM